MENIFKNVKKLQHTNAHGEVRFFKLEEGGFDISDFKELDKTDLTRDGSVIVGHSESGHHHLLERPEKTVVKKYSGSGMDFFYVLLKDPAQLLQDAASPHESQTVEAGEYIVTVDQEYDPFLQQARRVAD